MVTDTTTVCECGKRFANIHALTQHRRDSPKHNAGQHVSNSTGASSDVAQQPKITTRTTTASGPPADSSRNTCSVKGKQPAVAVSTNTVAISPTATNTATQTAGGVVAAQTAAGPSEVNPTTTTLQCCGRTFRASHHLAQHQRTASRHIRTGGLQEGGTYRSASTTSGTRERRAAAPAVYVPARTYYGDFEEDLDWGLCDKDCGWCGHCMEGVEIYDIGRGQQFGNQYRNNWYGGRGGNSANQYN